MKRAPWLLGSASLVLALSGTRPASAAQALHMRVNQHGDLAWIGNTSAQECAATATAPVVGALNKAACGNNVDDSAPDIFWRSDDPVAGQATATTAHNAGNARSTAVLTLPAGAVVSYARLYWGAQLTTNTPDTTVAFERPGVFSAAIAADTSYSVLKATTTNVFWYESSADVSDLVRASGVGAYRVSGINSVNLVNFNSDDPFVAWSLIVFYQLQSDPERNLTLYDGLDFVAPGSTVTVPLSGFLVPNAGWDAKLGVLAYEGDIVYTGDSLIFNGHTIADGVNPADNFFNGSRSWLGQPVSVPGDLPQMDGLAASMSGLDLDVVDITSFVAPLQTSATIQATSVGDTYMIGAFATSIATFQPDFSTTQKTFTDLNGGAIVRGDIIEYKIVATNTGNDTATKVVLHDTLPAGLTYVTNTINVVQGDNVGSKSDAPNNDQGDYDPGSKTITVRLGQGANATVGGSMAPGESTTITFRAQIDADAVPPIVNQAIVTAEGLKGNPSTNYDSGNGSPGTPTTFNIEDCDSNADCKLAAKPICSTVPDPNVCVQCLLDRDCGATSSGRVCDIDTTTCIDGCRGLTGNGCPAGQTCTSVTAAIGTCVTDADAGSDDGSALDATLLADGSFTDQGTGAGGGSSGDGALASGGSSGDSGSDSATIADGAAGAAGSSGSGGAFSTDGSLAADGFAANGEGGPSPDGAANGDGSSLTDSAVADQSTGPSEGDASTMTGSVEAGVNGDGATTADATDASTTADGSPDFDLHGSVEGGGCACATPGAGSAAPRSGASWLVALVALAASRRKRRPA